MKQGNRTSKRPLPPTYFLLSIVAMAALHFIFPAAKVIPFPWKLLGIFPFAAGLILDILADRTFKDNKTTVKPFEESEALVTSGMYRISRHPMYLGFVLMLIGIAVFMGSVTPYAVVIVFTVLMEVVFIRVEEKMVAEKFGEAWLEYKSRVRKWI